MDGPNSAGKSTLAHFLVKEHGAVYIHCKYRFKTKIFTYHQAVLRRAQELSRTRLVVIDRLWLSEDIYARVYRGGSLWPHEGRVLDKIWLKNAAIGVLCLTSAERAIEMAAKRAATYHSPELIKKPGEVAELYKDVWHGRPSATNCYANDVAARGGLILRPDWLKYEIEKEGQDLASFSQKLLEKLAWWRAAQYQPALNGASNIAGHLSSAQIVFVGDRVNYKDWRRTWPFASYSNSSLYLAKAMSHANILEQSILWTNAACPEHHVEALAAAKPGLKFVALGSLASDRLRQLGLCHVTVPHPSWALRFRAKQGPEWYSALLEDALRAA